MIPTAKNLPKFRIRHPELGPATPDCGTPGMNKRFLAATTDNFSGRDVIPDGFFLNNIKDLLEHNITPFL